jgi:hypothetical protein
VKRSERDHPVSVAASAVNRASRLDRLNRGFNPAKEVFVCNIKIRVPLDAEPGKEKGSSGFISPTVNLVLPDLISVQDDLAG